MEPRLKKLTSLCVALTSIQQESTKRCKPLPRLLKSIVMQADVSDYAVEVFISKKYCSFYGLTNQL